MANNPATGALEEIADKLKFSNRTRRYFDEAENINNASLGGDNDLQ